MGKLRKLDHNFGCGVRRHRRRAPSARNAELNLAYVRGTNRWGHDPFEREMHFEVFSEWSLR